MGGDPATTRAMRLFKSGDKRLEGVSVQALLDALNGAADDEAALASLAKPPSPSGGGCGCFDPTWNPIRCRKLALAVYAYLTRSRLVLRADGWRRASDERPVHVVFDTAGPWRAEWFAHDGVFELVVVHASTVAIWSDARRETRVDCTTWCEYAHPIEIADAVRHWDELLAPSGTTLTVANHLVRAADRADASTGLTVYDDGSGGSPSSGSLNVEQARIVDHVASSFDPTKRGGCMLCLGMGMGKTRVSLAVARRVVAAMGGRSDWADWRLVVVAPRGVLDTFHAELVRATLWSGDRDGLLYTGEDDDGAVVFVSHSKAQRDRPKDAAEDDLGSLARWADKQRAAKRRVLLLVDEAHHANDRTLAKEPTKLFACCMRLAQRSDFVIAMTGTPFVNAPRDATRMLRLASGDPMADAQVEALEGEVQRRNVVVAWLMTRTTTFPLQMSHRRPVTMKAAVWANLKRFYNKRAIEIVRFECERMKRGGGAAAEDTFRQKLAKTLRNVDAPDAVAALAEDASKPLATALDELEAAGLWSYAFYMDELWLKDTFYTKSEEYTYRCDDEDDEAEDDDRIEFYDAEFEPLPWTPRVAAATPKARPASPKRVAVDERAAEGESACRRWPASEHAASCFNEAVRLLDEVVAKRELPIVFHCGRLDPGVESLYDILLRNRKETKPQVSPLTYALITGAGAWVGTEQQMADGVTGMELVQRRFRAGEIDVLCFSRVAREGVAFAVKGPLMPPDRGRKKKGPEGAPSPTLTLAPDRTSVLVNRVLADKRKQFEKAVPCYDAQFHGTVPVGDDRYVVDALPPVRHFCHVGLTWNFATMRQAEARVMRRDSHARQHDTVAPFLHGVVHVHTIVTIRPGDAEGPFRTHDERMEALCYAKDGRILVESDRLSSSVPATLLQ